MLNQVRKLLRDRSPNWLNTEVNKNLLQNLSASNYKGDLEDLNASHEQVKPSQNKLLPGEVKRSLKKSNIKINPPLMTVKGTPHWRRINQVFAVLDNAPANYTYSQLIEYVRAATGKGCSRKLISKWKKQKLSQNSQVTSQKFPDNSSGDRHLEERTAAISSAPTIVNIPSTACPNMGVNSLQLTESNSLSTDLSEHGDNCSRMTVKAWSYLITAGITLSLVGCEILPFNDRPAENIAIASVTSPITPLPPRPDRRNRLEPRNIKIELTLSNPQDLKVKPGDKISVGQALSDRVSERNRQQARKKQLQLSLSKLNLPLTPIPQPQPIPEIRFLPPISYAEAEAAIKLKQQKLTEADRAIALQQKKIDFLNRSLMGETPKTAPVRSLTQFQAVPSHRSKGGGDIKLVLEHERANLANLEAARQSAQIQLEVAQSKLTTAKERRAYIEYQRELEQTRRAIAIEQQHQAIQRQKSERTRLLAEREFSQAQIEAKLQDLDYQIIQLSTVRAPYEGTIKKVKWTGQSDHNLTAVVTLAVSSDRPTIANSTGKSTPNTEVKQTTQSQP